MHEISSANFALETVGRRMPAREPPATFDVAPLATRQWSINLGLERVSGDVPH